MRFNPPPTWPPPPPGWTPDPSWLPDPSWPPLPPDWQLWVPETRRRRALWIALSVAAVLLVVAGTVFAVAFRKGTTGTDASNPSGKSDITQLTRDLLVDRSAFPDFEGGVRRSGLGAGDPKATGVPGLKITPEQCADLFGSAKTATQSAYASVASMVPGKVRSMEMRLSISPQRRDLAEQVKQCHKFTASMELAGRATSMDGALEPLDAPGAPSWAVASVMTSSGSPLPGIPLKISMTFATVSGYCRGVLVVAGYNEVNPRSGGVGGAAVDPDVVKDLVKLFNAQVQNLQSAP